MSRTGAAIIQKRTKSLSELLRQQKLIKDKIAELQKQMETSKKELRTTEKQRETEYLLYLSEIIRDTGYPIEKESLIVGAAFVLTKAIGDPGNEEAQDLLRIVEKGYEQYASENGGSRREKPESPVTAETGTAVSETRGLSAE